MAGRPKRRARIAAEAARRAQEARDADRRAMMRRARTIALGLILALVWTTYWSFYLPAIALRWCGRRVAGDLDMGRLPW